MSYSATNYLGHCIQQKAKLLIKLQNPEDRSLLHTLTRIISRANFHIDLNYAYSAIPPQRYKPASQVV